MKRHLAASFAMAALLTDAAAAQTVNFDDAKPRAAPAGWMATKTDNVTLFDDFSHDGK